MKLLLNEHIFTSCSRKCQLVDMNILKKIQELVKLGIVSAQQDGKNVFYINNDLVRILSIK